MTNPTKKINDKESLSKGRTQQLVYPLDLGSQGEPKYTIFRIFQYSKTQVNKVESSTQLGVICLPIPPELSNSDALNYEEFSAPLLNSALEAIQSDGLGDSAKKIIGAAAAAGASILQKFKGVSNGINEISALSGVSVNPRNTNIFKNVTAREHRYSYRLIAKSQEESIAIRQIINKFRYHAYPDNSLGESLYNAPDLFNISFKYSDKDSDDKDTFLFHPLPSALIAISVSYNGNNTPTFFQNSGAPVEVSISLVFREMEIDNKTKLLDRYNIEHTDSSIPISASNPDNLADNETSRPAPGTLIGSGRFRARPPVEKGRG